MINIKISPTTFQYICSEYTIYPAIVRERITEDLADGSGKVTLQFSNDRDTDANIKKLRNYIEGNF